MPFMIKELFFSSDELNKFKTSINFNTISSFSVNNSNVDLTTLTTADHSIISLTSNLKEFDKCILEYTPLNLKTSAVISHSIKKPSLYKTYSSTEKLAYNQSYTFSINIKGKTISSTFISKCNPYFSNIKKIREDCGEFLIDIPDETLNYAIYQNSKELVEKIRNNYTAMVNYTGATAQISFSLMDMMTNVTGTFLPSAAIPPYVKNWVRYKTDIYLLYQAYLTMARDNGQAKTIGPITIQNRARLPSLKFLLGKFQELFAASNAKLSPQEHSVVATVKGKNTQYPLNKRVF